MAWPRWSALPLRVKGPLVALVPAVPLLLLWALIAWAMMRAPSAAPSAAVRARDAEAALMRLSAGMADLHAAAYGGGDPSTTNAPSPETELKALRNANPAGVDIVANLERSVQDEERALAAIKAASGPPAPNAVAAERSAYQVMRAQLQLVRDQRAALLAPAAAAAQQRMRLSFWIFFVSSVVAVGGGLWAALGLMRGITRRIEVVVGAADQLAQGRSVNMPPLGQDEIGRLSQRLHELLQRLQDRERELARQNMELAIVNEELEAFSYSVSHDLRAPLRAIAGFTRVVEEEAGASLPPDALGAIERVHAATARMGVLIDELLKLSRVSRAPLHAQTVDLTRLATELVERQRRADPARQVDVLIAPDMVVDADPQLLPVALENLISNAWKFTGKVAAPEISISTVSTDREVVVSVTDNGAGFDMAHARMLFHPFQRLHTQQEFAGTGIGLATTQRIVRRHGGRIQAEGAVGQGARFTVVLPRAAAGGVT